MLDQKGPRQKDLYKSLKTIYQNKFQYKIQYLFKIDGIKQVEIQNNFLQYSISSCCLSYVQLSIQMLSFIFYSIGTKVSVTKVTKTRGNIFRVFQKQRINRTSNNLDSRIQVKNFLNTLFTCNKVDEGDILFLNTDFNQFFNTLDN
ncbi:hypothetical protein TTHERM_000388559 (macronuclear) [Tetrahymena thermophila SB210]|uniref:Uncharacterized protein n=1 Tax=Tetrahymena thermophila (strain SB210) TaxID=312017 RepID=W7X898_TETTS|nr:hypothetical protein TTHERM_000388559 [Tetrahymena thermophila SB210]EWS73572.1 hypothetical protein TTHERM_000388559 [Tetrahymena thermophila SB210]|eukprot:XP_012653895.1 hypothetical protein TTHERM_000388559 [Tetrahymena thermophila SB210]